jgi:hypothetical protein
MGLLEIPRIRIFGASLTAMTALLRLKRRELKSLMNVKPFVD